MIERRRVDHEIGLQPFGKQFTGHVVLVDAQTRGLGPAGKAADTVLDCLVAEVNDLNLRTGLPHAFDEVVEHEFGLALAFASGA